MDKRHGRRRDTAPAHVRPIVVEGEDLDLLLTLFEFTHNLLPTDQAGAYGGAVRHGLRRGPRVDPDDPPAVDDAFWDEIRGLFKDAVPALRGPSAVDEWVGLRTVTLDGRPIVEETTDTGFYLAVGMSGRGVTVARRSLNPPWQRWPASGRPPWTRSIRNGSEPE